MDYRRLALVALGGAVAAVSGDLLYTKYGDQMRPFLTHIQEYIAKLIEQDVNTPEPPAVERSY